MHCKMISFLKAGKPVLCMGVLICAAAALCRSAVEQTLYQFQGGTNGWYPSAAMVADDAGNLYGTMLEGGTVGSCEGQGDGCGTVFELKPPSQRGGEWTHSVIYTFLGNDGAAPQDPLITDGQGNLYGATDEGGLTDGCQPGGCGVVFRLSPPAKKGGAWTEVVLHYFEGVPSGNGLGDAAEPNNIVLGSDGNLYGMAYSGGDCATGEGGTVCSGAVFELERPANPSGTWKEKLLYIFNVRSGTGSPQNAFFDKFGNLDGTLGGGAFGFGEVFSLTPTAHGAWTLTSLHDFTGAPDGAFPNQGLAIDAAGNVYGTTGGGGDNEPGDGTVYELEPPAQQGGAWTESVIFTFTGITTGYCPENGPIMDGAGNLYGTTASGGGSDFGLIFKLTPQQGGGWSESTLYSFPGGSGGEAPITLNFGKSGAIFGTSSLGGTNGKGECGVLTCGFVFGVAP